jgi:cytidine deaminase
VEQLQNKSRQLAFTTSTVYPEPLTMSPAAKNPLSPAEQLHLRELAAAAAEHSYSPYSHFRVGAALLLEDGSIITGCNVENCSYRLTSCAEQAAIARAVSERGPAIRLRAVAVANLNGSASMPCGACRQTISEFAGDDVVILYPGEAGTPQATTLGALLPHAFRMEFLDNS